jgi:hypothetical protein
MGNLCGIEHAEDTVSLTEDLRYSKDAGILLVKGASEQQLTPTKLADVDLGFTPNNTVVFKDGHKYTHRTRDGRFARIIETGRKHGSFNVIALVASSDVTELVATYTENLSYTGLESEDPSDLIKGACPSIDWHRVAKGTPVRFYSHRGELKGVFSGPSAQGHLVCKFDDGLVCLSNLANLTIY